MEVSHTCTEIMTSSDSGESIRGVKPVKADPKCIEKVVGPGPKHPQGKESNLNSPHHIKITGALMN